jgi:hypothetical protein
MNKFLNFPSVPNFYTPPSASSSSSFFCPSHSHALFSEFIIKKIEKEEEKV